MDKARVIGFNNRLPWSLPEDMQHFKELTMGSTVLMGRNTFESLPAKTRPLPFRRNVVVTSSPAKLKGFAVETCSVVSEFIENFKVKFPHEKLWIIGGAKLYQATLASWDELYLTLVDGEHEGDTYFPRFEEQFRLVESLPAEGCSFLRYLRG